jgi:hypothetical protein
LITASAVTGSFSAFQLPTPPTGLYYVIETTGTQVRLKVLSGTPSQSWLAAANLPTDTSLTSDPDSDGVPLLLEYALGGSAALTDQAPVCLVEGSEALQIQFLWNTQASDVTAIVEGSSDLLTWTTLLSKTGGGAWTGAASFTEGTPTGNLVPMTVTDPITTSPRYLRIRIIKP